MNKIVVLLALLCSLTASNADVEIHSKVPFYILNAATAYDIDVTLMYAICMTESNCKSRAVNKNDATKSKKALGVVEKSYGLFQIKADTARMLGFVDKETVTLTKRRGRHVVVVSTVVDRSKDLLKPEVNALYAAKLLRHLYNRYKTTPKVISAYNAGHYTKANKDYVFKVLKHYAELKIDKRF